MESITRRYYGQDVYERERLIALKRDNYLCQAKMPGCMIRGVITHHIIPRRAGGRDTADNLITVCPVCHPQIEPNDDYEF